MLSGSSRIPNQLTNLCSKLDVLNVSKDCWCIHMYPSIYHEHGPPATISLAWSVPPQGRHPWNSWPKGFVSFRRNPKGWMDRKMRQMFWAIHDYDWIYLAWRQCQANEVSAFKSKWLWVHACSTNNTKTTFTLIYFYSFKIPSPNLTQIWLAEVFTPLVLPHVRQNPLDVGLTFLDPAK